MPSSNTTNKRKSQGTASTKQVLLGFASLKRTATGHVASKKNVQRTNSAPVRANVAAVTKSRSESPEDTIEDSDSSSSASADEIEEERITEDDAISTPVTRRSARISGVAKTKAENKDIVAGNGMFRSRNSLDSSPRKRPGLKKVADPGLSEAWRKHYGVARQKMGGLQPIHAENETPIHHILRVFDLSYEYGPCVGVPRIQRWERANKMGLNPPQEVYEILTNKEYKDKDEYSQSVFYGEEI
ncbi:hypothetical protein PLEOSDRAFT_159569 [Pleurotus ostreatus PC15]|uniref:DNA polymerase delta subunit 4 n=1 Tax=Pleurotus ostreatus (strain PC15) TaxID=1137138 RepID=A0A067NF89_PLEO1|nr:hypothetical protein PLEOSDRAFT_159569 [Pleurotus ostreatus PC15]